ncbi:MAG: AI-2E family transporter [Xanthomonadales bacterium]|nr:AI-2E family transporter [Xanthomonadales bacterium]
MNIPSQKNPVQTAIEIAINLFLIFIILAWCLQILKPFISLIAWAAIIAISMYKPFLKLKSLLGGNKKLALAMFTVMGLAIIVVPGWMFAGSIVSNAKEITVALETGHIDLHPPNESIKEWPLVGAKLHAGLTAATSNFQAWAVEHAELLKSVASTVLSVAAGIGLGIVQFLISTLIAAAFLANAETIGAGLKVLLARLVGDKADSYMKLTTATVTSVTVGVLGISSIQSFMAGLGMMIVGVPFAGILALLVLILCIAQLPPWLIMFPVMFYVFSVESTTVATIFAVWAVIVSFLDMVLKPIFLGRGVDAPMLVILLGAIGGMIMSGIIGLFVGAIVLALGYKLLEAWLESGRVPPTGASEET